MVSSKRLDTCQQFQSSGIEATRQVRKLVPNSKILFLSGLRDTKIVQEALRTGVSGDVVKSDVESELTRL